MRISASSSSNMFIVNNNKLPGFFKQIDRSYKSFTMWLIWRCLLGNTYTRLKVKIFKLRSDLDLYLYEFPQRYAFVVAEAEISDCE